jgi:hypothetical protein
MSRTCAAASSVPSSASSAEALAPMSTLAVSGLTRRGVSAGGGRTNVTDANGDLPAVGLVGDTIDLFQVVRVGDDLVTGDDVLRQRQSQSCGRYTRLSGEGLGEARGRRGMSLETARRAETHLENNHGDERACLMWREGVGYGRRRGAGEKSRLAMGVQKQSRRAFGGEFVVGSPGRNLYSRALAPYGLVCTDPQEATGGATGGREGNHDIATKEEDAAALSTLTPSTPSLTAAAPPTPVSL